MRSWSASTNTERSSWGRSSLASAEKTIAKCRELKYAILATARLRKSAISSASSCRARAMPFSSIAKSCVSNVGSTSRARCPRAAQSDGEEPAKSRAAVLAARPSAAASMVLGGANKSRRLGESRGGGGRGLGSTTVSGLSPVRLACARNPLSWRRSRLLSGSPAGSPGLAFRSEGATSARPLTTHWSTDFLLRCAAAFRCIARPAPSTDGGSKRTTLKLYWGQHRRFLT
mmetsp:Transcript_107064/g.301276  ORF Transcript_107064/g.301276 Transcript_107064/m.301276 type:complete len:230 (+) Transcript_107064:804-1493(+)